MKKVLLAVGLLVAFGVGGCAHATLYGQKLTPVKGGIFRYEITDFDNINESSRKKGAELAQDFCDGAFDIDIEIVRNEFVGHNEHGSLHSTKYLVPIHVDFRYVYFTCKEK